MSSAALPAPPLAKAKLNLRTALMPPRALKVVSAILDFSGAGITACPSPSVAVFWRAATTPEGCSFTLSPPALSAASALKMGGWSVTPLQAAPVTRNAQCRMGSWGATPAPADSARLWGQGLTAPSMGTWGILGGPAPSCCCSWRGVNLKKSWSLSRWPWSRRTRKCSG